MRSLLFVPADGGSKLDKAFASGADAMIIDLEDSIAPDRKAQARESAAAFLKNVASAAKRPRLLVRVNAIATGLIDADLDAVVHARPDAILLPKAEGAASVIHADAKLSARETLQAPRLADLARLDDAAFRALFTKSPVKRTGRDRFVRNVLIAIGNAGDVALAAEAERLLGDASPLVRGAAVWALARLDPVRFAQLADTHSARESDTTVRDEWIPA